MTPVELIKSLNFSINKGDIIVYKGQLVQCVEEPLFSYMAFPPGGDERVTVYTDRFEEASNRGPWELHGYLFRTCTGKEIQTKFYDAIEYSRYIPGEDRLLDRQYQKFMWLLEDEQEDGEDE